MLKKSLALALALLLTLSVFSGCSVHVDLNIDQEKTPPETQSAETKPTATEPPTEATEPPVVIDYDNLVCDAYSDVITETVYGYESTFCYHIPQFNLPDDRAKEANDKIYTELYAILDEKVYHTEAEYPWISLMHYNWGANGRVASVVIRTSMTDYDWTTYQAYTISLETGKVLSAAEVAAAFDLTEEGFYDTVRDTMTRYWKAQKEEMLKQGSFLEEMIDELANQTLADENVRDAVPYINRDGELCFIAMLASPAGAGAYYHLWNTGEEIHEEFVRCDLEHPAQ